MSEWRTEVKHDLKTMVLGFVDDLILVMVSVAYCSVWRLCTKVFKVHVCYRKEKLNVSKS